MTPIDQTILSSPGVKGNCLQACVASLLDCELNDVPAFHTMSSQTWQKSLIQFMYRSGYAYYGLISAVDVLNSAGYLIVYGSTERSDEIMHAVIYLNGKLVHDPHPSKAGLRNIMYGFDFAKLQYD